MEFFNQNLECLRTRLREFLPNFSIENWLEEKKIKNFEPFYSSIDIRDSGFKIAPVDANLYPAGFNNLCPTDLKNAPKVISKVLLEKLGFFPKKMLILPESNTKNKFYIDNVIELKKIFELLGIEVKLGWWEPVKNSNSIILESSQGLKVEAFSIHIQDETLFIFTEDNEKFIPEFILLNNDFSLGVPHSLFKVSQPIHPSVRLGWHTRKKSDFFRFYNELAAELALKAKLDPWVLQVETRLVSDVDFQTKRGLDRIAFAVDDLLEHIRREYENRKISKEPFVFVKSNSGTYGMGITKVKSGKEVLEFNRRERNKMDVVKNRLKVSEVIVQEGIPTRFELDGVTTEPVIYLCGNQLIGGFLRQNPNRGREDNLNSQGMVFKKLCLSDLESAKFKKILNNKDTSQELELELVYGAIAQLSVASIALETKYVLEKFKGEKNE